MIGTSRSPCHSVSIELEELEQVLSFLSVSGLLFGCQGVIRHKQGMGATTYQERKKEIFLNSTDFKEATTIFDVSKNPLTFGL